MTQNTWTIRKTALELAGATIVTGTAYTPVPKPQPNQEVISKYLKNGKYCGHLSETRKQELSRLRNEIRSITAEIKRKSLECNHDTVTQFVENYTCILMSRTKNKDYQYSLQAGKHLQSLPMYLKAAAVRERIGSLTIELV